MPTTRNNDTSEPYVPMMDGEKFEPFTMLGPSPSRRLLAHHLSLQCRYNNGTPTHYSVAQHSVMVAEIMERGGADPVTVRWALLHDAAEAYLPDVPRSIKEEMLIRRNSHTGEVVAYRDLEERILRDLVAPHYGLPWPVPPDVKKVDYRVMLAEIRDLFPLETWNRWAIFSPELEEMGIEDAEEGIVIRPVGWRAALHMFSRKHRNLFS